MNKKEKLLRSLEAKNCLKVIAGINNFNKDNVLKIVGAANKAKATCVDICAEEEIIESVLDKYPEMPIFVSSIKPTKLKRAMELGADVLELGNFEVLHEAGIFPSVDEIIAWAEEIMDFTQSSVRPLVSITVPGHLSIKEQVDLAERLEEMGVDIIQTEGASLVNADGSGALGHVQKVSLTLANTMELAKVLETTYILTASGISPQTAPLAIASGAHGVGVGRYVNKLDSELGMTAATSALLESLGTKAAKETAQSLV